MIPECPICGYNPSPPDPPKLTDAELMSQRIKNYFSMNLNNTWWLSQPEYICAMLKDWGINPKSILDVGCGDGRWGPSILKSWPTIRYIGIDSIREHIEDNLERMPDFQWFHGEIQEYVENLIAAHRFDLILLSGTLQEKGRIVDASSIINAVRKLAPQWIVVLLDKKVAWEYAASSFFIPEYSIEREFSIPKEYQGPGQDSNLWIFKQINL